MATGVNSIRGEPVSGINMTPMLGVLLVLVVLFLVIQAGMQRGLGVWLPSEERWDAWISHSDPLVLEVEPGPVYRLNRQPVHGSLQQVLAGIFAGQPRKEIFIKGAENLAYGDVVRAMDDSRRAGVQVVELVPRLEAAPAPPERP